MSGYETLKMYIDGDWCDGSDGEYGEVINPATEEVLARLPHAGTADLDRALRAAAKGFEVWRRTSPAERGKIMRKAADLMRERLESIARTLTLEEGKTIGESRAEVATSADIIEWYGQEGQRTYGRVIPPRSGDVRQIVVREPIGPVAAFTPWNFPGVTPARKIGGALGAGCSIIIKASEETPGTCVAMVRALADAGLPTGVCNLVFGVPARISEYLIPSPIIRKVSFTGSIPVGKHLARLAAEGMKPATMELGGHSPVIVFDDVDVEKVAQITVAGKYRNAGQVCISPTRFFVHDAVYDKFVSTFSELAKALPVGNGLDEANKMGSLANDRRMSAMDEFIGDAVDKGAKIMAGGERIGNQGFFYQPTVLGDVPDDARIMNDEPFGPIAPMQRWSSVDEMVKKANGLPYGLAAYAFTKSNQRAAEIADALESGMVGVNHLAISLPETPFGGVKESGYGKEGGVEGLDTYMISKFVTTINA